jgi:hypothetical protein
MLNFKTSPMPARSALMETPAALKEIVWLYHLLLAWAEADVPHAEAFCQASPDLAADPRYKHW